jgi:N-acetylglucosaminyl-diphospho-decaprenol L-rhamnosyltransferase
VRGERTHARHSDEASSPRAVDVSVIIVSWNVRELLKGCIRSLLASEGVRSEIIVVDNASADGTPDMIRSEFPSVELIASSENLGFSRGNNLGLARATGRYVFFLNPDTVVASGAISQMVGFLDEHPEAGMVGPKLTFADGTAQPLCHLPSVARTLFHALYLDKLPLVGRWSRALPAHARRAGDVLEVEAISGAAMLARRGATEDLGGFDESFLYTCEDIDLCLRLRRAGARVFVFEAAEIVHFVGQSSEQVSVRAGTMSLLSTGQYFERFHGRVHAYAFRLVVQLFHMPLMVGVGIVRLLLGRGSEDDVRERLRFARAVWRWELTD